jgi:hypothetical protein
MREKMCGKQRRVVSEKIPTMASDGLPPRYMSLHQAFLCLQNDSNESTFLTYAVRSVFSSLVRHISHFVAG